MDKNLVRKTSGHSKEDLRWYARWRQGIWSKIIEDTFVKLNWGNLNGKRVLEIGYGDGRMAVMFVCHGAQYIGYEIDDTKLTRARRTAEQVGVLELTNFCVGDFMKLQGMFDYIFVKSVLYRIREEKTYRAWLKKINALLVPGGKFIALENGMGVTVNRWIRKWVLQRSYEDALLYCPRVEQMFRDTFAKVDVQYFFVLANLTPCPLLFAKLESYFVKPNAQNCFAAGLICDK